MSDSDALIGDCERRMVKTLEVLQQDFAAIRTGRASPSLLDKIPVDAWGSAQPIQSVASISVRIRAAAGLLPVLAILTARSPATCSGTSSCEPAKASKARQFAHSRDYFVGWIRPAVQVAPGAIRNALGVRRELPVLWELVSGAPGTC